ncbi:MAG: hypothetical protein ACI8RA_001533 [Chlamydiales bacterium]|jgi:hypothetical protein
MKTEMVTTQEQELKNKQMKDIEELLSYSVPQSEYFRILNSLVEILNNYENISEDDSWVSFNKCKTGTVYRNILYHCPGKDNEDVLVVLKYDHAEVDFHYHSGEEHILVLEGYQETLNHEKYDELQPELFSKIKDDRFNYTRDDGIVVNNVGTGHSVKSDHCLVLIHYKKLPEFPLSH